MKKALTITIGGILFTIEEDAYEKLKQYLDSIKAYFASYDDSEIIDDIEARIAEQLIGKKDVVLNTADIDRLISVMGKVEDFKESEPGAFSSAQHSEEKTESKKGEQSGGPRKLFRDPDTAVIFGVSSGLGYYFGLDPLIVRLCFIILTLITQGGGLILYIILALLVPKATTAAEKVQMRGGPVDLNSFRETVRDQVNSVKKNGGELIRESRFRDILERSVFLIGKLVKFFFKLIAIAAGIFLSIASVAIFLFATFALLNFAFNADSPHIEFPLGEVLNGPSYYLLITLAYLLIIAPLAFALAAAAYLINRKKALSIRAGLIIAGIWIASLLAFGTLMVRIMPGVNDRIDALPQYQVATSTETLSGFDKLDVRGIYDVHITQSPTFSISESGRQTDIERTRFEVKGGTLVLTQGSLKKTCYFCPGRKPVDIVIGMPSVQKIETSGIARVTSDMLTAEKLTLELSDASRADLAVNTQELIVVQDGATRLTLTGTSSVLKLGLDDIGRFDGTNLAAGTTTVETKDASRATVNSAGPLTVRASDASSVTYIGTPAVTEHIEDAATVRSSEESDDE